MDKAFDRNLYSEIKGILRLPEKERRGTDREMNVVAYCRVSTDKTDQLNSLETQKKFFREYCEKNSLTLVKTYADEGISGTKTRNRKEFLRMMEDAREGKFKQVLVKDVSRLARNTVDLLQSVRTLRGMEIDTIFITANMQSMGNSEFVLTLLGAVAQEESANTSKRIKFGKRENAGKGRVPNLVYGYDKIPGDYFRLLINQEEAKVVRQIFHWYVQEGYGASKIAAMLNEKKIHTKRDCLWSQNAISRILKNEIYIGKVVNGKEEVADFLTGTRKSQKKENWLVVAKPELAIISLEDFEAAQSIIKERNQIFSGRKQKQSNKYLFSTLLKCSCCGYSFRRMQAKTGGTYWVCSGRNSNGTGSCKNKTKLWEEDLLYVLEGYMKELKLSERNIKRKVSQNLYIQFQNTYQQTEKAEPCISKKKQLVHQKDKLLQLYYADIISGEELKYRLEDIQRQIEENQEYIEKMQCAKDNAKKIKEELFGFIAAIKNPWAISQCNNTQLKKMIEKIIVEEDEILHIYFRKLRE